MCGRCDVVRSVDLKFMAFWDTTAYSLVDGYENVGRQDPEGLSLEGCYWFYKRREILDEPSCFSRKIGRVHCQILAADGRECWLSANYLDLVGTFPLQVACGTPDIVGR
jgi:hypothetical protein